MVRSSFLVERRRPIYFDDDRPLPPYPSIHPPGSLGKIADLEWRAEHGCCLYHPDDALYSEEERALFRELIRGDDNSPLPFDFVLDNRSLLQKLIDEDGGDLETD